MIKELTQELRKLPYGTWKGEVRWPALKLLETVYEVASMASRKKIGRKCPQNVKMLINIYKDEDAKKRSIDTYNLTQEGDSAPRGNLPKGIPAPPEDVGDFD